ncbi:MAG TPA: sugar ABC transporter substrate-binding protein [Candidatus Limnocylindrales bacterium]|nr:sugar ABC transporter substrate-binding protein [Candidatus Limnocylindrales bacterium]
MSAIMKFLCLGGLHDSQGMSGNLACRSKLCRYRYSVLHRFMWRDHGWATGGALDNSADRRRNLITDLAISLASGLIVTAAVKVYSVLKPVLISPSWLWLFGAAAAAIAVPISMSRHRRRPKQVFILVSAFVQKHWVNKLLHDFMVVLGQHDLDMVFKAPVHDYSGHGQVRQLIRTRRKSRDYAGGFIMVTDAADVHADLANFSRSAQYPIVFLDQQPFNQAGHYPPGTAFVGCDPAEIGAQAAEWATRTFSQQRIRRPNVFVVGSNEHRDRQNSFVTTLKQRVPGAVVTVNDQGRFVRERCREIVERHLKELSQRGEQPHLIFCTNDEMALGAVDAIQERNTTGDARRDITVVGVDGTDEALAVIRSGATAFKATVVQDSQRVADVAVRQLLKLRAGQPVEVETYIPTTIYPMQ